MKDFRLECFSFLYKYKYCLEYVKLFTLVATLFVINKQKVSAEFSYTIKHYNNYSSFTVTYMSTVCFKLFSWIFIH